MATAPPVVPSLPTPTPDRFGGEAFDNQMQAWLSAFPGWTAKANQLATWSNTTAAEVDTLVTSATGSASTATTKAGEAATSAGDALVSRNAAKASETAALASKNAAAGSATAAATSATNAGNSATDAAASAASIAGGPVASLVGLKGAITQAQVNATVAPGLPISTATQTALNGKEPSIAAGTTSQFWRGDKAWQDFAGAVRSAVLTGLSTATSTVVAAADSVLVAIGKLQAQVSVKYGKENILGTVSQTAGVPTGAIIQRGSNGNGTYIRWADGTQIATWTTPTSALPAISDVFGGIFRSTGTDILWTFPLAFASTPCVSGAVIAGVNGWFGGPDSGLNDSTSCRFRLYSGTLQSGGAVVQMIAIGRWF